MSLQQPSSSHAHVGKILIIGFLAIVFCGLALYLLLSGLGEHLLPPTPAPGEVTAAAHAQATRVAAARSIVPSLVRETGIITAPFTQPRTKASTCFDGMKLWVSYANQLIALDPETREIVLGPIEFDRPVSAMMLGGKQLWVHQLGDVRQGELLPTQLMPVDVASGQPGAALLVPLDAWSPVYDGQQFWFATTVHLEGGRRDAVQAIDSISRKMTPPIETGTVLWRLVADGARQVLWLINSDGKIQQYDLRQNVLRDTPLQLKHDSFGLNVHFDGQRLWTVRGRDVVKAESVGQSLDVDTGKTTDLASSTIGIVSSAFDGKRIWLGNEDWTVQPLDITTGQLGTAIPVYGYPGDLQFDGQRLWVALYDEPRVGDSYGGRQFLGLQYLVPKEN